VKPTLAIAQKRFDGEERGVRGDRVRTSVAVEIGKDERFGA
jgi:hypothetical protein